MEIVHRVLDFLDLEHMPNTTSWMTNLYIHFVVNRGDVRTKGWFLVDSPVEPFCIVLAYICFSTMIGPTIMEAMKPFQIKRIIMIYDIIQVVLCLYFVLSAGISLPLKENFFCMNVLTEDEYRNDFMANMGWFYYMLKYLDLLDTVFFVLTKKFTHISFLHLFHHGSMIGVVWFGIKYFPGGAAAVIAYVNCWVHAFMYTYYFSSLYFGSVETFFKKVMTLIQLFQFLFSSFIWSLQLINPMCDFPKIILLGMIGHALTFTYLFSEFYYKTYVLTSMWDVLEKDD